MQKCCLLMVGMKALNEKAFDLKKAVFHMDISIRNVSK